MTDSTTPDTTADQIPKPKYHNQNPASDVCRALTELSQILDEHYSRRQETTEKTMHRLSVGIMLMGLIALMTMIVMFTMINKIDDNMQRMTQQMVQMRQYMEVMEHIAENIDIMSETIQTANHNVVSINLSVENLSRRMDDINVHLHNIDNSVSVMPDMRTDTQRMVYTMYRMQHDTAVMQHGVHRLGRNVDTMFTPINMLSTMPLFP